jgi:hypothetical protein
LQAPIQDAGQFIFPDAVKKKPVTILASEGPIKRNNRQDRKFQEKIGIPQE